MRQALHALTDELRRLKASGVRAVTVSEEGLESLRRLARAAGPQGQSQGQPGPQSQSTSTVQPGSATASPSPVGVSPPRRAPLSGPSGAAHGAPCLPPTPSFPAAPADFDLPAGDKPARLAALKARMLADPVCLAHVRAGCQLVFGVGDPEARIFFVGEAPGAEEEVQGEPFVGPAGQLLTRMIGGMGLSRERVYIANIMTWRPEMAGAGPGPQFGNRPPVREEMQYCIPFLKKQIEIVDPALIVGLGVTAAQGLLGPGSFRALHEIRGEWREFGGKPLIVTYHPSFILRNPTNKSKRLIWVDLLKVMERAGLPVSEKQKGFFLEK